MSITGLFLILSAQLVFISGVLAQGSLTPPGAPGQTMKTLDQVEPRTDLATVAGDATYHHVILQPGSYYLSGNLAVTKTSGIQINAAGVTLDLSGFEISRASGSGGDGIYISSAGSSATIRNGSITGFQSGINSDSTVSGCLLEKFSVSGCTSYGILAGASSRIIDCRAHDNLGSGLYANAGSSLEGCTADSNQGSSGIHTYYGSSLVGCTASGNQSTYGINAGGGSSLIGCTVYNNAGTYGIYAGGGSTLQGCTARNNTGSGSVSYGIYASGSTVVGCSAGSNTNTNSPGTATQGTGIYAGSAGIVKDCTVSVNEGDGIRVYIDCLVSGNLCDNNGNGGDGAGICALNSDNRIDGNNVTDNDRGIDVDTAGSFITRNSASGNSTNYDIAAGNDTGTIQTSPVGAGAWDNFEY